MILSSNIFWITLDRMKRLYDIRHVFSICSRNMLIRYSKLILRIMIHSEYFEFTSCISTFIQRHTSLSLSRYSFGLRNFPVYVSGEMECGREHIHDRNMSIFYYGQSSNCDFSTSVIVLYFLFRYVWIIDIKTEISSFS